MKKLIRLTFRWHPKQQGLIKSIPEMVRGLDAAFQISDGDELTIDATFAVSSVSKGGERHAYDPGNISEIRCHLEIDNGSVAVIDGQGQGINRGLFGGHNNFSRSEYLNALISASDSQQVGA